VPTLHILAGPNGAGKTTLYEAAIKPVNPTVEFVNPDRLAATHFGHNASTAAEAKKGQELADERRAALMASGKSLVTESTFSHPSKLALLAEARAMGYKIAVYHVNVRSAEISIARVKDRVTQGGHDVPEDRIRGRYERNKALIKEAVLVADRGRVFDNSRQGQPPELALAFERGRLTYASTRVPLWAREVYATELERLSASSLNASADSFDQAKIITRKLLGDDAKTYISREGIYRGEILGQTALHTLQRLGAKSAVAHFTNRLKHQPTIGSHATIQYRKGEPKALVQERPARAVAFEKQAEAEAVQRYPELKPAYDILRAFEAEGRAKGRINDDNADHFRATLKDKMLAALNAGQFPKLRAKERTPTPRPEPQSRGPQR
jgi:predicted ABC-type ATPase